MKIFEFFKGKKRLPRDNLENRGIRAVELNYFPFNIEFSAFDKEKALALPTVAESIDYIANIISTIPIKLYKNINNKITEIKDDPRLWFLNDRSGGAMTSNQLKAAMVRDYFLGKGGYAFIEKYKKEITGIYYVSEEKVFINEVTANSIFKKFLFTVDTEQYRSSEFLKLLRATENGVYGKSILKEIFAAIQNINLIYNFQANVLKKMGKKTGYYQVDSDTPKNMQEKLIEEANKVEASNGAALLSRGITYTSIGQTNRDMQLSELKKQVDEEIQKVFHIKNDFYDTFREAIYPIIKSFEKTINLELLTPEEVKYLYFKFDTREIILSANAEERYKAYISGQKAGLLTINEIRKFEGLEELKELDTINFGLNSVLYNVKKGTYFIPNTSITMRPQEGKNPIKEETISENIVNEKEYSGKEKEEIGNNKNKK